MSNGSTILVVSGVGIDTNVQVPALPLAMQDTWFVPPIHESLAHAGNGMAMGLHAFGEPVVFVDVIGADDAGRRIRREYADHGLTFHAETHPAGTRRSVNLVDPDGRRMSLYDARQPYDFVPDSSLWRTRLPGAKHVHCSVLNWARYALHDAIAAGISTSTDVQDWDGVNEHHLEFALTADLVFISAAALADREQAVVKRIFTDGRAHMVVITDGARGSRVYRPGEQVLSTPAATIADRPIVDTNGAGDSHNAVFLSLWLRGVSIEKCARAAAYAGAYACGAAGTHTAFITPAMLAWLVDDDLER